MARGTGHLAAGACTAGFHTALGGLVLGLLEISERRHMFPGENVHGWPDPGFVAAVGVGCGLAGAIIGTALLAVAGSFSGPRGRNLTLYLVGLRGGDLLSCLEDKYRCRADRSPCWQAH